MRLSAPPRFDKTRAAVDELAQNRLDRRKNADDLKKKKEITSRDLQEKGKFGDSDFVHMIEQFRRNHQHSPDVTSSSPSPLPVVNKINVAIRKRPSSEREIQMQDHDSVTCSMPPHVYVHASKFKVDGITKVLETCQFEFDFAFDSDASNEEVYRQTTLPLVKWAVLEQGRSTIFAYGQTGSGKTFTMEGLQQRVARDLFDMSAKLHLRVLCSNFELYGEQCLDLLNDQKPLPIREDDKRVVHIVGLREEEATSESELLAILNRGSSNRTTRATEMNTDSSRSHSIFQIRLSAVGNGSLHGCLLLVDLAGSERGQDTTKHDAQRRAESAAINTSLLSLKECIRALETGGGNRIPYRQSKLTMVLKDSFSQHVGEKSRTLMIGCVSPASSSADHTLNTLRYADRVKEKKRGPSSSSLPRTSNATAETTTSSTSSPSSFLGSAHPNRKSLLPHNKQQQHQRSEHATTTTARSPPKSTRHPTAAAAAIQPKVAVAALTSPPPPPPVHKSAEKSSRVPTSPDFQKAQMLIDEEDALLLSYRNAVQENFLVLAEENDLLEHHAQVEESDIGLLTQTLKELLEQKLMTLQSLHDKVLTFQAILREEGI